VRGPSALRGCINPALFLTGLGHWAVEPTMLCPSLKASLQLLILTGEWWPRDMGGGLGPS